ncbi:hypothetical protein [Acidilutibacter cellobiosedens]|nr:hypothetical protein [Acidilutibacter cellobiosedens]
MAESKIQMNCKTSGSKKQIKYPHFFPYSQIYFSFFNSINYLNIPTNAL